MVVMTAEISQTGSGATPTAGGTISATRIHTTVAPRLAVRTRRTPSAWSACWYARSRSGSSNRSVHRSRRSHPAAKATWQVYGPPLRPDLRRNASRLPGSGPGVGECAFAQSLLDLVDRARLPNGQRQANRGLLGSSGLLRCSPDDQRVVRVEVADRQADRECVSCRHV